MQEEQSDYTPEELDLAMRYHSGQINETQFNFLVVTKGCRREKVEELIDILIEQESKRGGCCGCLIILLAVMFGFTVGLLLFMGD